MRKEGNQSAEPPPVMFTTPVGRIHEVRALLDKAMFPHVEFTADLVQMAAAAQQETRRLILAALEILGGE